MDLRNFLGHFMLLKGAAATGGSETKKLVGLRIERSQKKKIFDFQF
jgi:hypothetical protein